jgi:hypothetical protein
MSIISQLRFSGEAITMATGHAMLIINLHINSLKD